jgi:FdhE protein
MARAGTPLHEPIPIGDVATPPFVRLPDPRRLFADRAQRFRQLAINHRLEPYLTFLAGLCDIQHRVQEGLSAPVLPDPEARARARDFGMPPLDRSRFPDDPDFETAFEKYLSLARAMDMPKTAAAALTRLEAAGLPSRRDMIEALLANAIPFEMVAEHGFVAAFLQVHFARLAAGLDPASLVPVGDGVCPVCGGPPATSMVVGWLGAHGARYCGCSLCGTLWNYVRIKCTLCGSTQGISYQEVDGGNGMVKAETCTRCRGYVKILHQHKDPALDIIADDVASLDLDLLMRETAFRRGGINPFLIGY